METCVDVGYASAHESMLHRNVLKEVSLEAIHWTLRSKSYFGDWSSVKKLSEIIGVYEAFLLETWLKRPIYALRVHVVAQIELDVMALVLEKHFQNLSVCDERIEIS